MAGDSGKDRRMNTKIPVALVTGAARRLGAAIATSLHDRGFQVALHYRNSAAGARDLAVTLNGKRPDSTWTFQADLCDPGDCRGLVAQVTDRFGALDLLVNNASSFYPTPIESITEEQFDDLLGSNLKGPVFLCSAAAPHLDRAGGSIVNITDIHARHPIEEHPVYCAAKAGLESLTRALARDMAPRVRVNAVAPGAILWPERGQEDSATREAIIAGTELERMGTPRDIADAVAWLAADAGYVTGQVISVDGGRTLGP